VKLLRRLSWERRKTPSILPHEDGWRNALLELSRTLLTLLQQYRYELEEIQSRQFSEEIDKLKMALPGIESPEELDDSRRAFYECSIQHLKNERKYLEEREAELKSMIAVLSEAIASISAGNESYHNRIMQTTQTLGQISQLEDIRKIRSSLAEEVQHLKQAVREKQSKEREQHSQLSDSVESLQSKLQTAINRSLRDPLTDLYNRQGWDQELVEACRGAAVTGKLFAVALVDVDNFKKINDSGGHQVGDLILKKLAEQFRNSLRAEDFIARLGGDEFAIVFQISQLAKAERRLDRLCRDIAKPTYNCAVDGKDFYLKISISIGLSLYRPGDNPESLFRRADEALYVAKGSGKSRVATESSLDAKSA